MPAGTVAESRMGRGVRSFGRMADGTYFGRVIPQTARSTKVVGTLAGAGEFGSMFRFEAVQRRAGRVRRLLIWLQIALLTFAMVAPTGAIAVQPGSSEDPPVPSAEPTPPPPDPTPDPTAEPDPDPSVDPILTPTPSPAAAPSRQWIVTFIAGTSAADQAASLAAVDAGVLDSIAP